MAVHELVAEAFDREVLESELPVVVDFYADWCMPCRAVAPELETLSERWAERARFVKVDVDRAPELARHYGVTSIPTVLLFQDGEVRASTRGATTGPGGGTRLHGGRARGRPRPRPRVRLLRARFRSHP